MRNIKTKSKTVAFALFFMVFAQAVPAASAQGPSLLPTTAGKDVADAVQEKTGADKPAVAEKQLPPCLAEIYKAQGIEDGALKSGKMRDSLIEAQKLGAGARANLMDMAQTASPAGRLISIALLKKLDPPLAQKLAETLKQEAGDQSVSYISPTERCHYSVSDILNDLSSARPLIKILPPVAPK